MSQRLSLRGEPFFHPVTWVAWAVFAVNNFWAKEVFGNAITGKLSDFAFCFVAPTYVAALLRIMSMWCLEWRLSIGMVLTTIMFASVKLSRECSDLLNLVLGPGSEALWGVASVNVADSTDLCALSVVGVSWIWARKRVSR